MGYSLRIPCDLWGWRGTTLVVGTLLLPLTAVLGLANRVTALDGAAAARTILVAGAMLAAALLLHLHGRLAGNAQSLWVSSALAVSALVGLGAGGHALTHPDGGRRQAAVVLTLSISVAVLALVLVLVAARTRPGFRPALLAGPLVVGVLVAQQLVATQGPGRQDPPLLLLGVLLGLVSIALVVALLRLTTLPLWARTRFGAAAALIAVSVSVGAPVADRSLAATLSLGCGLVGGVVLASTAAALLRMVLGEEGRALSDMRARVAGLETEQRADQARWHEISTIVAGVTSASQLIAEAPASDHRQGLQVMVLDELGRLQRMLSERSASSASASASQEVELDLDEVVRRIALAHRARGREVDHVPSGLRVRARADDVAEVLNILVDNAAVHGRPDGITVSVEREDAAVAITVADLGPGVDPELRRHLFDWGTRRSGSPGQGIGLYAACELARGLGGTLRLDRTGPGSRFVLRIPDPKEGVDARAALAHLAP